MSKKGNNLGEREFRELRKLLPLDGYVSLTRINILKVPEKWFIEPRVIPDFHLLFVCRGKGTYWINGKGFP